jgi:hypothetical protein
MKKQDAIPGNDLKVSKKLPFRVPENYFEELPLRIQERMQREPATPRLIELIRPRLAYAAMIIGFLAVGYLGMRIIAGHSSGNGLTADEIAEAIEYYAYQFDDEMFVSTLDESDLDYYGMEADAETEQFIEYLSEDYIDFSIILTEY